MQLIPEKWSDELATGLLWQDYQHRELVGRLNQFHGALEARKALDSCKDTIVFLDNYIQDHFGIEEAYMRQYDFPGAVAHIAEHKKFTDSFRELKAAYEETTDVLALAICFDLNKWIVDHIRGTDQAFGKFFQNKP